MSLASRGAEFFRFCIVGGLTFLVDYGLLFLLTSVLDVHYLWSSAWAFIVAVIVNYYLCVFFVFHQAARSFARQVVFVGSSLAGLGINQVCMWLLVDKLTGQGKAPAVLRLPFQYCCQTEKAGLVPGFLHSRLLCLFRPVPAGGHRCPALPQQQ